ncbi:peptidylprolyl isomerase [Thomasclavelia sp.]|uniref:peptidylprolyl isomerase n=1 Tax=Thomasclavelia sp. TaxID=3025757 RepID=UPI0025D00782|nr:peptidylprolyl isomerase [Thomasclavelia sp.]
MKLGKCAVAFVVTSFLLTGCQNNSKTVTDDGKDVIASLEKGDKTKNILADDVFNDIISTASGKNTYFDAVLQQLIDQKFPVDDDMETDADETISQVKNYYESNYGEDYEEYLNQALTSSGFESMEQYREYMIQAYQRSNFLLDYVEKNFDEVYDDYYSQATPREASIIKISMSDVENPTEEESAKLAEIQALLATSKSFNDIASEYSDDDNTNKNDGKLGIVDTTSYLSSTYGEAVESEVFALAQDQVSSAIKGTDGYYFIKVTNSDKDSIKKKIKKDLSIDTPLIAYDNYMYYLAYQSYNLKYDDKEVEKLVNQIVTEALEERETSRGGNQ